jgi:hypothetical protein
VYDLETSYLNDSSQYGNVLKGFEGFLSQTKNTNVKKARNFKPEAGGGVRINTSPTLHLLLLFPPVYSARLY